MRRIAILFAIAGLAALSWACKSSEESYWRLVWSDDFEHDGVLNNNVWSKIPRGHFPWNNYMSDYDTLYAVQDGNLILRGMVNDLFPDDTAAYITGGVYTKDKIAFHRGRLEIRAKMQGTAGAWPAVWMLPQDDSVRMKKGEIDIVERLNYDDFAYQTVHNHYTLDMGGENDPPHYGTNAIDPDDYNVYAVSIYADSLVFDINGSHTFTYPRVKEQEIEDQFPYFNNAFYLLMDMQLGGPWPGEVDPAGLPIEMRIDWVKYFRMD